MKILYIFIGFFNEDFMESYTTTIGHTIYLPDCWDDFNPRKQDTIVKHELVHIKQLERHGLFYKFAYLFLWFPVIFAYYRCKFEAEAYVINIENKLYTVDDAVNELYGSKYCYAGLGFGKKYLKNMVEKEVEKFHANKN